MWPRKLAKHVCQLGAIFLTFGPYTQKYTKDQSRLLKKNLDFNATV